MNKAAPCADQTGGLWPSLQRSLAFQILLLLLLWQAGEAIARLTHLPIPGSVIAMGLVLLLLGQKILHPATLQRGARWFLAEMVLFLLPSVIPLLAHPELFGRTGLKLLTAILLGTLAVMLVTALVVETCFHLLSVPQPEHISPSSPVKRIEAHLST